MEAEGMERAGRREEREYSEGQEDIVVEKRSRGKPEQKRKGEWEEKELEIAGEDESKGGKRKKACKTNQDTRHRREKIEHGRATQTKEEEVKEVRIYVET